MPMQVLAFAVMPVEHMRRVEGEDFGDFHRISNGQIALKADFGGFALRIRGQADMEIADAVERKQVVHVF